MKMFTIKFSAIVFFNLFFFNTLSKAQTIIYSQDFQNETPPSIPVDMVLIDNDGLTPANNVNYVTDAWVTRVDFNDATDIVAVSTSWYSPAGKSDDWIITPQITLGSNSFLSWEARAQDANFPDGYKVMISTSGTNISDFTANAPLFSIAAENSSNITRNVSLSAYSGQNVYIAFVNNSTDKFILILDDISVYEPTGNDGALSAILSPNYNGCALSSNEKVTITIQNLGSTALSNFKASYQINALAAVTETVSSSISPGGSLDYTFVKRANLSAGGVYTINAYVTVTSDLNPSNNTLVTSVVSTISSPFANTGIESADNFGGAWLTGVDDNGDHQGWTVGTNNATNPNSAYTGESYISCAASTLISNDDWFFSPCLDLTTGQTYLLKFYAGVGGSKNRKLKIMIGTNQTSSGMTDLLLDSSSLTAGAYREISTNFTVSASGTYYIGFNDYSDSDAAFPRLYIDDINIYPLVNEDLGVIDISIFSPNANNGCTLSTSDTLLAAITNFGLNTISSYSVVYTINGLGLVTENISTPINPGDTVYYQFNQTMDLSIPNTYVINAFTVYAGDNQNNFNDSSSGTVQSIKYNPSSSPVTIGWENSENLAGWVITDNNLDGTSWFLNNGLANSGNVVMAYDSSQINGADDWFFSPCMDLTAGTNYELSFYYRMGDPTLAEDMIVKIGSDHTVAAMNIGNTIVDLQAFQNDTYQQSKTTFSVTSTGTYYIGFQAYSAVGQSFILVDDINIELYNGVNEKKERDNSVTVYPNPSSGKFVLTNSLHPNEKLSVEVTNILGQILLTDAFGKTNSATLDLSSHPDGVYFIKIITSGESITKKIVLSR